MGSRAYWILLLAPLAPYGCGADGDPTVQPDKLQYQGGAPNDGGGVDAGTPVVSRTDAAVVVQNPRTDSSVPMWADDPLTEDNACAASSVAAEQVQVEVQVPVRVEVQVQVEVEVEVQVPVEVKTPAPVALYVMFDNSWSMYDNGLWTPAVQAVTQFVRDPASTGMDVALKYFPGNTSSCVAAGYNRPDVAMGKLPGNANAIANSLASKDRGAIGTPIEGALHGVTDYCKTFQAAHPDEKCIAVLVTDGKPEFDNCSSNQTTLVNIAKKAWETDKVRTFAVGLQGADFGLLDKIAQAGGAADCDLNSTRFSCDVSTGPAALTAALAKIRDTVTTIVTHTETHTETRTELQTQTQLKTELQTQVRPLECAWRMPQPAAGETVDSDRVNVAVSGGTGAALELGRVPGATDCKPNAWYFDHVEAPTSILACPQTCDSIKAGGYTEVKVLLGCQTVLLI